MRLLILGFGYSAAAVARALKTLEETISIAGTVRTEDKAAAVAALGVAPLLFDGTRPADDLLAELDQATHLLVSIPPDAEGDPVLRVLAPRIESAETLEWLGYFSTVGVYGDFDGAWVDETAPCEPVNKRSQMRVAAEAQWRALATRKSVPLLILRLAGIYGPGRSGFDKLRQGTARRIHKPGQVFNRIHVDDIGHVTALAAMRKLDGTFNLSDNSPAPPQEVVAFAATLLGMEAPPEVPFETADMTPMARSFYADNKRVRSTAILDALDTRLLFPSYLQGLPAVLDAEQYSFTKC